MQFFCIRFFGVSVVYNLGGVTRKVDARFLGQNCPLSMCGRGGVSDVIKWDFNNEGRKNGRKIWGKYSSEKSALQRVVSGMLVKRPEFTFFNGVSVMVKTGSSYWHLILCCCCYSRKSNLGKYQFNFLFYLHKDMKLIEL